LMLTLNAYILEAWRAGGRGGSTPVPADGGSMVP
jgi:hypothetical protein